MLIINELQLSQKTGEIRFIAKNYFSSFLGAEVGLGEFGQFKSGQKCASFLGNFEQYPFFLAGNQHLTFGEFVKDFVDRVPSSHLRCLSRTPNQRRLSC